MGPLGDVPLVDQLLLLVSDISTPIKIAWGVCVVWSVVQVVWFRRGRRAIPPPAPAPLRAVVRKPSAVVRPARPVSSSLRGGSPEFLAALGLQEPAQEPAPTSAYRT